MSPFLRFLLLMLGIDLLGFGAAGVLTADQTIRLYIIGATLLLSPFVAFYAVYGADPSAIENAFDR